MLFNLLAPFADDFQVFNLLRYLTFRTGSAMMTALFLSFLFGPLVINWLKSQQGAGQPIRTDGPETHLAKAGTPTMGVILFLLTLAVATACWANLLNRYVWTAMFVTVGLGSICLVDNHLKLVARMPRGVPRKVKLALEIGVAGCAGWFALTKVDPAVATGLAVPFLEDMLVPFGFLLVSFTVLVLFGVLNALGKTDQSTIVPIMTAAGCLGLIAFLVGNAVFANSLQIAHVPGTGELAVFCGALIGAGLAFMRLSPDGRR